MIGNEELNKREITYKNSSNNNIWKHSSLKQR